MVCKEGPINEQRRSSDQEISRLTAVASPCISGEALTSPSFCTTTNQRVYITAGACELELGGTKGLLAACAGGL